VNKQKFEPQPQGIIVHPTCTFKTRSGFSRIAKKKLIGKKSSVLSSNAIIDTTEQNCGYISSKESPSWKGKSFRLLETFSRHRLW
jgi:hypothetical protein